MHCVSVFYREIEREEERMREEGGGRHRCMVVLPLLDLTHTDW